LTATITIPIFAIFVAGFSLLPSEGVVFGCPLHHLVMARA